jgi:hypothetical protein
MIQDERDIRARFDRCREQARPAHPAALVHFGERVACDERHEQVISLADRSDDAQDDAEDL